MVRGEPEHGLERDVPVEAPIVSEDKLVEIGVTRFVSLAILLMLLVLVSLVYLNS